MIRDYPCTYLQTGSDELLAAVQLPVPELHRDPVLMAAFSREVKSHTDAPWCSLPFCHTIEAEALGAKVRLGDRQTGPRIAAPAVQSLEELSALPPIKCSAGRMGCVLEACKILAQKGENVLLEVGGPFTVLSSLCDGAILFRALRKDPDRLLPFLFRLSQELLEYVCTAVANGVRIISYADPTGGVSIVGPGPAVWMLEHFTIPFLKMLNEKLPSDVLIHLCPKTAYALLDTGCAELQRLPVEAGENYAVQCAQAKGKVRFVGQTCLKNNHFVPREVLEYLTLK